MDQSKIKIYFLLTVIVGIAAGHNASVLLRSRYTTRNVSSRNVHGTDHNEPGNHEESLRFPTESDGQTRGGRGRGTQEPEGTPQDDSINTKSFEKKVKRLNDEVEMLHDRYTKLKLVKETGNPQMVELQESNKIIKKQLLPQLEQHKEFQKPEGENMQVIQNLEGFEKPTTTLIQEISAMKISPDVGVTSQTTTGSQNPLKNSTESDKEIEKELKSLEERVKNLIEQESNLKQGTEVDSGTKSERRAKEVTSLMKASAELKTRDSALNGFARVRFEAISKKLMFLNKIFPDLNKKASTEEKDEDLDPEVLEQNKTHKHRRKRDESDGSTYLDIHQGVKADPGKFPFVVALEYICKYYNSLYGDHSFDSGICTGSLISNRAILTAGHCVPIVLSFLQSGHETEQAKKTFVIKELHYTIIAGAVDRDEVSSHRQVKELDYPANITMSHPPDSFRFRKQDHLGTMLKDMVRVIDVAVLLVKGAFVVDEHVNVAAIRHAPAWNKFAVECAAVGFDWKSNDTDKGEGILRYVRVEVGGEKFCTHMLGRKSPYLAKKICAKAPDNRDACRSDTGGPLACRVMDVIYLVGVASRPANQRVDSLHCGKSDTGFGVYESPVELYDWITKEEKNAKFVKTDTNATLANDVDANPDILKVRYPFPTPPENKFYDFGNEEEHGKEFKEPGTGLVESYNAEFQPPAVWNRIYRRRANTGSQYFVSDILVVVAVIMMMVRI